MRHEHANPEKKYELCFNSDSILQWNIKNDFKIKQVTFWLGTCKKLHFFSVWCVDYGGTNVS